MIGVLGPEGTISHELAERLFPGQARPLPTIRQIFAEVEAGRMEGLVPLENSEAGGVGATLDGLLSQDPALYADILQMNPETGPALAAFEETVRDLRERVISGNPAAFEEFFRDTAACFRDDSGRATEETDRMIAFLAEQP